MNIVVREMKGAGPKGEELAGGENYVMRKFVACASHSN
jgi:hypothetical protein